MRGIGCFVFYALSHETCRVWSRVHRTVQASHVPNRISCTIAVWCAVVLHFLHFLVNTPSRLVSHVRHAATPRCDFEDGSYSFTLHQHVEQKPRSRNGRMVVVSSHDNRNSQRFCCIDIRSNCRAQHHGVHRDVEFALLPLFYLFDFV